MSVSCFAGVKQQHVLIPFISTSNVSMEMHVNMGGEASSQALFKIHGASTAKLKRPPCFKRFSHG